MPRIRYNIINGMAMRVYRLVREGEIHAYCRTRGSRGLRILASELREYVASIKIDKERWRE